MGENKGKCFQVGVWFFTEFQHEFLLGLFLSKPCNHTRFLKGHGIWMQQCFIVSLVFINTDETAAGDYHVATSCIREIHCGLTILSSNANGAHEFKVIAQAQDV